jgi:hypothetical protein
LKALSGITVHTVGTEKVLLKKQQNTTIMWTSSMDDVQIEVHENQSTSALNINVCNGSRGQKHETALIRF